MAELLRHTQLQWSDLYGWAELATNIGKFGGWIGGISAEDEKNERDKNNAEIEQSGTGRCAFWWNPNDIHSLTGISLQLDGQYRSNEIKRENSSSISTTRTISTSSSECFSGNIISLWKLNEKLFLNAGLDAGYCTNEQNSSSYYSYRYSYYTSSSNSSSSKYDWKNRNVGFHAGIVTKKSRAISLIVNASTSNTEMENSNSSYSFSDQNHGNLALFAEYADAKKLDYLKHSLKIGINCIAGTYFPIEAESYVSFSDIPKDLKKDERIIFGLLRTPVVFEINMFNKPIYSIIRLTPQLQAHHAKSQNNNSELENRCAKLDLDEIAIGVSGTIKDRIEFSLIPSLKSNIFATGLEIRYNIPGKKKGVNVNNNQEESIGRTKVQ